MKMPKPQMTTQISSLIYSKKMITLEDGHIYKITHPDGRVFRRKSLLWAEQTALRELLWDACVE